MTGAPPVVLVVLSPVDITSQDCHPSLWSSRLKSYLGIEGRSPLDDSGTRGRLVEDKDKDEHAAERNERGDGNLSNGSNASVRRA